MRISTTTLDSFRLWSQPDQDWMTEADLLASIRGEFVPTPPVLLGKAFGRVLEAPDQYYSDGLPGEYRCDGYVFPVDVMAPAMALMDPKGIYEAKATKDYGDCTVVAMADQLSGARLIEHKTTLGTFDFDKYAASYQWRFMVDIFQPVSVTYHVFLVEETAPCHVGLRGIESFTLYPYAGLHEDCADLVRRFAAYARLRGVDGLLRERQQAA
jgi:hypothetical protein